jgi:tetratricopeptide (TPR) repeat protein
MAVILAMAVLGCAGARVKKDSAVPKGKDSSYYYLLSEMEMRRNAPSKALAYIEEALAIDPSSPRLWYKKAFLEATLGDLKKAEEGVKKSLALDPDDREANVLFGKICQSQDRRPEAIAAYKKALKKNPSSEEANVLLIETYIADKQFRAALGLTQAWQGADPDSVLPIFYEAWIHQNFLKNTAKAIAAYQRVIEIDPSNAKALSALAEIYVARKDDRKALEAFDRLEALAPNDANLKIKAAVIYYEQKQYDKAVEKFRQVLRDYPNDDRIIYYMGVIQENLKNDGEARVEFEKIKPASNFFKDARLHLSFLKLRKEDAAGAVQVMEESIRQKPQVGPFYEYLAEIHRDRKEYEPAVDALKRGLKKSPEKESLWYNLGMVYDKQGRFDDMVRSMREVLKINPENANALNYLGYSYAERGVNLDEALTLLQKALALKPGDGFITDSLGWAHYRKGDVDRALAFIQKAYGMVPGEPTITEHLGDVFLKRNERAKALKFYREAEDLLKKKATKDEEAARDLERVRKKLEEMGR